MFKILPDPSESNGTPDPQDIKAKAEVEASPSRPGESTEFTAWYRQSLLQLASQLDRPPWIATRPIRERKWRSARQAAFDQMKQTGDDGALLELVRLDPRFLMIPQVMARILEAQEDMRLGLYAEASDEALAQAQGAKSFLEKLGKRLLSTPKPNQGSVDPQRAYFVVRIYRAHAENVLAELRATHQMLRPEHADEAVLISRQLMPINREGVGADLDDVREDAVRLLVSKSQGVDGTLTFAKTLAAENLDLTRHQLQRLLDKCPV